MYSRNRPLGRPRRRWEDNIRMNLKEICINTWNWVDLAQDRDYWRALVNAALNFRVSQAMELIIRQVLAYADDVSLIGDDIRIIERNSDVLLNACVDIGVAVNTGKTKYMEIGRHRGK